MNIGKAFRLSAAAVCTFAACLAILYIAQPQNFFWLYRCFEAAESKIRCYQGYPTNFRTTTLGSIFEGNTADYIDRRVLLFGAYEKPELFFLRDVARKDGVFVDIGANKGLYSLFMAKYQKQVHAFEPYEPVLVKFRRFVEINGVTNIVIHPVGLGDKEERHAFARPPEVGNMGLGSFAFTGESASNEYLQIVTGDQALNKAGVARVDLIKMDIEGYEKPALAGLAQTLAKHRPIVVFEVTIDSKRDMLFKRMDQIVGAFPKDYVFFVLKEIDRFRGTYQLLPADSVVDFTLTFDQHNLVAVPMEKQKSIPLKN